MKKLFWASLLVGVGMLASGGPASADIIYGVVGTSNPTSNVYSFDDQTGTVTLIGPSGLRPLLNLATAPSGALYSVGGTTNDQLATINPATGAATVVTTLSYSGTPKPNGTPTGLSFSPTGDLFEVAATEGHTNIYRIDPTTGVTTLVGDTGKLPFGDLAFSPSGTLYGYNAAQGLMTVNTTTGVATTVGSISSIIFNDMAFRSDGTLWAARSSGGTTWMNINLTTGAATATAFNFGVSPGIQGIQFAPVPIPAAVWLFGSGLVGLVGLARRKLSGTAA